MPFLFRISKQITQRDLAAYTPQQTCWWRFSHAGITFIFRQAPWGCALAVSRARVFAIDG